MINILNISLIQIKTDKRGREFAQYWHAINARWIRCNLEDAKAALSCQMENGQ